MAYYERPTFFHPENKDILYPNLESCPSWIPNRPDGKNDLTLNIQQSDLLLSPGDSASITLNLSLNQLPPVELYPSIISDLRKSTRSCIAQSGVFFDIDSNFLLNQEQINDLNLNENIQIPGTLRNFGSVTLKYLNSDAIGRLYHVNPKDQVTGNKLEDLLLTNIFLGEIGKDYLPLYNENGAYAIALKVGPKRHYLPASNTPIRVSSRPELYSQTQEVTTASSPEIINHRFHLLETTVDFNLPNEVMGILSHITPHKNVIHLPSHLIDPGSKWKVRLEIDGDMKITDKKGSWVLIRLYQSPLCSFNVAKNSGTYDPSLTIK